MEYNERTEFTENEIREIIAVLNLLDCLDPEGTYLKNASAKIILGIDHGCSMKTPAQIIKFPKREN